MPPHLILNEANQITNHIPPVGPSLHDMDPSNAPPGYGQHQDDMLWGDIDPSGYMTPAGGASEANTPQIRSRNTSFENLGVLANASPNASPSISDNVSPHAVQHRLNNLPQLSMTPNAIGPENEAPPRLGDAAAPRRASAGSDDSRNSLRPEHIEYDPEAMSKVPSYQTAVRAPAGTPMSFDLPNYEAATGLGRTSTPPPVGSAVHPSISAPARPSALPSPLT